MIDTKEIRQGNKFEQGLVFAITYLHGRLGCFFTESTFSSFTNGFVLLKDIQPVLLTEKILEDNGFKSQIGYYKLISGEMFKDGGKTIEITRNDGDKWYVGVRDFNEDEPDDFLFILTDLKYIHELQNIYYDLTKEELFVG